MNRLAEGSFRMLLAALFFSFAVSRVAAQVQGQTPRTPPLLGRRHSNPRTRTKIRTKTRTSRTRTTRTRILLLPSPLRCFRRG